MLDRPNSDTPKRLLRARFRVCRGTIDVVMAPWHLFAAEVKVVRPALTVWMA
jgi:hypothetical protein